MRTRSAKAARPALVVAAVFATLVLVGGLTLSNVEAGLSIDPIAGSASAGSSSALVTALDQFLGSSTGAAREADLLEYSSTHNFSIAEASAAISGDALCQHGILNCNLGGTFSCLENLQLRNLFNSGLACLVGSSLYCYSCTYAGISSASQAANNTIIGFWNSLNGTASGWENMIGTSPELDDYLEDRATSVVPAFLGASTWNASIEDDVLADSGDASLIAGYEYALGYDYYQDYRAMLGTFDTAFGPTGSYKATGWQLLATNSSTAVTRFDLNQYNTNLSGAWINLEVPDAGYNSQLYFTFDTGENDYLVEPDVCGTHGSQPCTPVYVHDDTTGVTFQIPQMNYTAFIGGAAPPALPAVGIGPEDLLNISAAGEPDGQPLWGSDMWVFTSNASQQDPATDYYLSSDEASGFDFGDLYPENWTDYCIGSGSTCITEQVPLQGTALATGAGPGSLPTSTTVWTSSSSQLTRDLVAAEDVAYEYWVTLRLITDNGKYSIPANCVLSPPQDSVPADTNPSQYGITGNIGLIVYWAWLEDVARFFGSSFVGSPNFCADENLTFGFNWSAVLKPALNITASVYLATDSGAQYVSGSADSFSVYGAPGTWPVVGVVPTFVFPTEYELDVPVGSVYPLPVNDPAAIVLWNWSGNSQYQKGNEISSPDWGLPTYLEASGHGNYVEPSGNLSGVRSGSTNDTGDAIYISSCIRNNVSLSVCPISVNYVVNLTVANQSSQNFSCTGSCSSGGGILASTNCGEGALDQWYDSWAGGIVYFTSAFFITIGSDAHGIPDIGPAIDDFFVAIGCLLAWVVLILIILAIAYVIWRVFFSSS